LWPCGHRLLHSSPPRRSSDLLQGLPLPRRLVTILEGESVMNDASSLIVFRFALAAVVTGEFVLKEAIVDFFLVAGGGILIGVVLDRKSTRLNSSHVKISYAVF